MSEPRAVTLLSSSESRSLASPKSSTLTTSRPSRARATSRFSGFKIAMHDAELVRLRQRVAHLHHHRRQPRERSAARRGAGSRPRSSPLHSSITRYIEPPDSPKSNTCTVLRRRQARHRLGLAAKALPPPRDPASATGAAPSSPPACPSPGARRDRRRPCRRRRSLDHAIAPVDDAADERVDGRRSRRARVRPAPRARGSNRRRNARKSASRRRRRYSVWQPGQVITAAPVISRCRRRIR